MTKTDGSLRFDTKIDDSGFSSGMNKIGGIATKAMTAMSTAAVGLSGYAIKVGADFQAGMSEVAAISGASSDEVQKLTDKAKEMGIVTKFSATEASEAMKYMAMAGWDASQMVSGISGIMNLAAASGEELGSVSDIVTDALTAFGLQAKDSAHFADVLAKASSSSNTNVGMMGETFKYAAPLAGTLGYSVEDTAVAIGLMANAGIKGSQAGTAMRGMLSRLIKPTDEVQGAMDALGITISNADGTIKPFNQLMREMRSAFANLTDEEKAQRAASLAGQEAMSGFLAIINASDSDFEKLSNSINNADGTAQKMADTMNDNLKGKITLLGSSLEGLGIAAFEHFEKPLKKAVEGAMDKVNDLSHSMSSGKLSKSMSKVADGFGAIVETVLDLAADALPLLVDGFAFLIDNGKKIIPILTGIGSGMMAMKGYQKYIMPFKKGFDEARLSLKLFETANNGLTIAQGTLNGSFKASEILVGVLTGKITLATAAQSALNAAQSLSPHVWLIAGIAGVTAALTTLAAAYDDTDPLFKHNEAIKEAKKSYEELETSKTDMITSSMESINHYETLKEKLETITDETGKVKKGYEGLATSIVGDLNEALGTNIEIVDGQIVKYDEAMKQVDKYIAKMKASAVVEAQAEQMKKIEELYEQNNKELAAIRREKTSVEKECEKKEAELRKKGLTESEIAKDAEMGLLRGKLNGYQNQEKALQEVQNGILDDRATYYDNLGKLESGRAEDLEAINNSELAEYTEQGERITKTLEEQHSEIEADIAAHEEAIKNTKDTARKKILEDELEALKKQKTEKEKEMKLDRDQTSRHLTKTQVMWGEAISKVVNKANIYDAMLENGLNGLLGFTEGLKSQKGIGQVMGAMGEMSIAAVQAFKDNLKIKSPSRVFAALAKFVPEGVAVGIGKAAPVALNAVKTMGSAMSDKMLEYSKPLSEAFNVNTGFQKLRNVAINRMQNAEGMLLPMTAASGNQQTRTKLEIVDRSQNSYSLVLENGAELAHWLAPHMNRELGMLKG